MFSPGSAETNVG